MRQDLIVVLALIILALIAKDGPDTSGLMKSLTNQHIEGYEKLLNRNLIYEFCNSLQRLKISANVSGFSLLIMTVKTIFLEFSKEREMILQQMEN